MKGMFSVFARQGLLLLVCLLSINLSAHAQQPPPVIQWQKLLEAGNSPVRAVKAANGGYGLVTAGKVFRLAESGNMIWQTQLPTSEQFMFFNFAENIVAMPDGGFVVLVRGYSKWSLARLNAAGTMVWVKPFADVTPGSGLVRSINTGLIKANDGGFIVIGSTMLGRNGSISDLYKFDPAGDLMFKRELGYNYGGSAIRPISIASSIIQTVDGGYLLVGSTGVDGSRAPKGWAVKLDAQLNPIWQKRYEERGSLGDVILSPYFNGSFVASGINNLNITVAQTLNIGPDGEPGGGIYQPGKVDGTGTYLVAQPAMNGNPAYHTVLDGTNSNGGDIRLLNLTHPDQDVWTKTLGGSGNEIPTDMVATDDGGYLVVGTTTSTDGDVQGKNSNEVSTWVVKLVRPASTLTLTQPSYNCQTGAITFNTSGGDGSPITFTAPGIARARATDNFGTVEQGLRNDPKLITITATQSGYTTSYMFDFGGYCNNQPTPIDAPTLINQIPDQTRTLGEQLTSNIILISSYFRNPGSTPSFRPIVNFKDEGLPNGMILFDSSNESNTLAYIGGTPTATGVYTVTVSAFVSNLPSKPTTTTTFKITIVDKPTPGGNLTLTPPTYICQTGAITFNTSGGDGSPITYSAPGISRANVTDNFGTVEQGLRNDPKPITITATQSGYTTSYMFDFGAYCLTPPTNVPLTLLAPIYDCATGAFMFRSTGGDGSPVEYSAAPGITGWTTNPNQFVDVESRTANDVQPFTLMARQNGQVVTYTWDLKAACGRAQARVGRLETGRKLTLKVLGNPVVDQLRVQIEGATGQTVQLNLTDANGRLIESRRVESAQVGEEQRFELGRQNTGLLLLRAATNTQTSTAKILKQ